MIRLRLGKLPGSGGVPTGYSLTMQPSTPMRSHRRAVARRVDQVRPGADHGDGGPRSSQGTLVRGGIDAQRQAGDDAQAGAGQGFRKGQRIRLPWALALRLPTMASMGEASNSTRPFI
jgi:hypothetical protein